jgi:hypothetical protein
MGATIGDGMYAVSLAGGIVAWLYMKYKTRQKKLEVIHQERLAAMEKGIPLPEFPPDPSEIKRRPDQRVLPILGIVLFTMSLGTMIMLYIVLPPATHNLWISPLPIAFLGVGLTAFHFSKANQWQ